MKKALPILFISMSLTALHKPQLLPDMYAGANCKEVLVQALTQHIDDATILLHPAQMDAIKDRIQECCAQDAQVLKLYTTMRVKNCLQFLNAVRGAQKINTIVQFKRRYPTVTPLILDPNPIIIIQEIKKLGTMTSDPKLVESIKACEQNMYAIWGEDIASQYVATAS